MDKYILYPWMRAYWGRRAGLRERQVREAAEAYRSNLYVTTSVRWPPYIASTTVWPIARRT